MRAVWTLAVVMVVACGTHSHKTVIQRESEPAFDRQLELLTDNLAIKAKPALTINGVSGPLADGVRKRLEASRFPSKGGLVIDINEETDIKGSSGEYKANLKVDAVFAQSPHAIVFIGLLVVHLTYSNATPEQLGESIGDGVVEWLESEKLPADIGPRTGTIPKVTRIAAGSTRCTLHDDGSVRCWNSAMNSALPVPAAGDSIAVAASGTFGACGVRKNGRVWCVDAWNGPPNAFEVRDVCGVSGAREIDVGDTTACAILADGRVQCWLDTPRYFEPCAADSKPIAVDDITDAVSLTHGHDRDCAIVKDGTAKCWPVVGFTARDPKDDYKAIPDKTLGKPSALALYYSPCTKVAPNKATCPKTSSTSAIAFTVPDPIKQLVAADQLCALTDRGDVFCASDNTPATKLDDMSDMAMIASDAEEVCGVTTKNVIMCRSERHPVPTTIEQMP